MFFREENQYLYIADTSNDRIIISDLEGNVQRVHLKPESELLPDKSYKPKKIIVDNIGIMFITSANVETGALLVDSSNNFLGFYGANRLAMTAEMRMERFWRSILPQAANKLSSVTFQSVEFNNMFWSEDRFVYVVSSVDASVASSVSKLNALGVNVFPKSIELYNMRYTRKLPNITLTDITVDNEGAITIVDITSGHIYQYDEGCNLLAVFGGVGHQAGLFSQPVSIESDSKNSLLVLDAGKKTVTVMEQTFYGEMIRSANYLYNEGRYQESIEPWMEVLRMNANYTQAYVGLGKAYISMGEYEKAMEYFELGKDREGYGEAKGLLRDQILRENFALVAAVVIVLLVAILAYEQVIDIGYAVFWRIKKIFKKKK